VRGRIASTGAVAIIVLALGACSGKAPPQAGDVDASFEAAPPPPPLGPLSEAGPASDACAPDPANFDVPGNGCDDDGDGKIDNLPACDDGSLPITGNAAALLQSMGLCQVVAGSTDRHWGVVSANMTASYGSMVAPNDAQHGILPKFGSVVVPREGKSLAVLSSGFARELDTGTGSDAFKGLKGNGMQGGRVDRAPVGYPKTSSGCPVLSNATFDLIDLVVQIKVPKNALGLSFDFDFWSGEWPEFVCTPYNDTFIAYLTSMAVSGGSPENVSFDANGNTVSVNNGFFDRCTPGTPTGCSGNVMGMATCPGGPGELAGTGFLDMGTYCGSAASTGGGATGWLTSKAPVMPGELLTIELMVWDTGDPNWDSSVLLDHFQWLSVPVATGTGRPE
jgi:hypothetical protein